MKDATDDMEEKIYIKSDGAKALQQLIKNHKSSDMLYFELYEALI